MVSTNPEVASQEILAEFADESNDGEEFFPSNIVILLMLVVKLTGVADRFLYAILYLREDGSNGVIGSVTIQQEFSLVIRCLLYTSPSPRD